MSCFAAIIYLCCLVSWLFDDRKDVIGVEDFVFLAIEFDFSAAVFANEDTVTLFDFEGNFFAVIVGFSGAERNDEAFGGFFFGGIGNDDAALLDFLLFGRFNQNAVAERFYVYSHTFFCLFCLIWFRYIKSRRTRCGKRMALQHPSSFSKPSGTGKAKLV